MSDDAKKYFTVDEANRVVRRIRPLVERMTETVQTLQELAYEVRAMFDNADKNGGHPKGGDFMLIQRQLQEEIETLHSFGCVIKDPGIGLLDFLTLRDGQEVELCWRLGEDRIEFWHDINAGYRNRQPL